MYPESSGLPNFREFKTAGTPKGTGGSEREKTYPDCDEGLNQMAELRLWIHGRSKRQQNGTDNENDSDARPETLLFGKRSRRLGFHRRHTIASHGITLSKTSVRGGGGCASRPRRNPPRPSFPRMVPP